MPGRQELASWGRKVQRQLGAAPGGGVAGDGASLPCLPQASPVLESGSAGAAWCVFPRWMVWFEPRWLHPHPQQSPPAPHKWNQMPNKLLVHLKPDQGPESLAEGLFGKAPGQGGEDSLSLSLL